ncbi:hypothetical protein GCM10023216_14590 [Isoptericola chiayiensis]|uniref:DUF3592 domain-containing protein n=1 Tax=Isoptericola chiayiensis TaxID=579446 RepID=A0ABP8YC07_9MICO|nr:hypothetical protein [Isoptericola chiayiensis]NOW02090.1 hypothetical protein [Isoptericola chiayiensis]
MMIDLAGSGFFQGLVVVVGLAFALTFLIVAILHWRRRRVFSSGVRGSGVVVRVEPTPVMNRYSLVERPTEMVTVATQAMPAGATPQKVPAGQYVVGQEVPVVQPAGRPHDVRLDRPDLEPAAWRVLGMAAMALAVPVIVVRFLADGA